MEGSIMQRNVKCPLMTVHDLDCIEDCGNVTCKHWGNNEDKKVASTEQIRATSGR